MAPLLRIGPSGGRRRVAQALLYLSAALLVACSTAGGDQRRPEAAPAPAAGPASAAPASGNPYLPRPGEAAIPIKVGTPAVSGGFVQLYAAQEGGLFREYGFDVEVTFIPNVAAGLAALAINEIQFYYGAADG